MNNTLTRRGIFLLISTLFLMACEPKSETKSPPKPTYGPPIVTVTSMDIYKAEGMDGDRAIPPQYNSLLGWGYSTATNTIGGKLLSEPLDIDTLSKSAITTYYIHTVNSTEDLYQYFGLQQSASLKLGIFKANEAVNMIEQHQLNRYSSYLIARVLVKNGPLRLSRYRLNPDVVEEFQDDVPGFLAYSGDEFINEIITGGAFYIVYSFTSENIQDQKAVQIALHAESGGLFSSVKFSAALTNIERKTQGKAQMEVRGLRIGDYGPLPAQDLQSLMDYAVAFPETVRNSGDKKYLLEFNTTSIKDIPKLPKEFKDVTPILLQKFYLRDLAEKKIASEKALTNVEYVLEHNNNFDQQSLNTATELKTRYIDYSRSIQDCVDLVVANVNDRTCNLSDFVIEDFAPQSSSGLPSPSDVPETEIRHFTNGKVLLFDSIPPGGRYKVTVYGLFHFDQNGIGLICNADGHYEFNYYPERRVMITTTLNGPDGKPLLGGANKKPYDGPFIFEDAHVALMLEANATVDQYNPPAVVITKLN